MKNVQKKIFIVWIVLFGSTQFMSVLSDDAHNRVLLERLLHVT